MTEQAVNVLTGIPSKALFYGVGKPLSEDSDLGALIAEAGLEWEVVGVPIRTHSDPTTNLNEIPIPSKKAIVRIDNRAPLGVVGHGYVPVQNGEYLEQAGIDTLLEDNKIIPVRGGSFYMGDSVRVWMVFSLPGSFNVGPSDVIKSYLIFNWSHDGMHSLSAVITNYNTTKRVFIPTGDNAISIRHTRNVKARIHQAQDLIKKACDTQEFSQRNFSTLVNALFKDEDMADYLERLFPKKETLKANGELRENRSDKIRDDIMNIFKGIKDTSYTKWAALSSVVEWVDHERKPKKSTLGLSMEEARLNSIWFGNGAGLKIKAMKELQ